MSNFLKQYLVGAQQNVCLHAVAVKQVGRNSKFCILSYQQIKLWVGKP